MLAPEGKLQIAKRIVNELTIKCRHRENKSMRIVRDEDEQLDILLIVLKATGFDSILKEIWGVR